MPCLECDTNHYCSTHGECLLAHPTRQAETCIDCEDGGRHDPEGMRRRCSNCPLTQTWTEEERMNGVRVHDHPCGVCTKLAPCSCQYPAVSYDFICDPCHAQEERGDVVMALNLTSADVDTFQCVLLILERDQTHRSMAARLRAVLDRAVKP